MPNTLAHLGAQGPLSRGVLGEVDPRWVATGCVLPDVPWIAQRALRTVGPTLDLYDLRLYSAAQGSLFFTLLLCAALALLARRHRFVFLVLAANVLLHLLLDGLQTKWANGVHLFAPFSWSMRSLDLFWPEHVATVLLTAAGVGYVVWALGMIWRNPGPDVFRVSPKRVAIACALVLGYVAGPVAFLDEAQAADNHFVGTLRDVEGRPGRYIEFDRVAFRTDPDTTLMTFTGEMITVTSADKHAEGTVSLRGRFSARDTVVAEDVHQHWPVIRELSSMVGLAVVAGLWLIGGIRQPSSERGGILADASDERKNAMDQVHEPTAKGA